MYLPALCASLLKAAGPAVGWVLTLGSHTTAPGEPVPAGVELPARILNAPFPVTAEELRGHLYFLSHDRLRGRAAGGEGARIAALYVAAEFHKFGLRGAGVEGRYEQAFTFEPKHPGEPQRSEDSQLLEGQNVLAWLPGAAAEFRDEYVVLGAHLDHLGVNAQGEIFNGADDNASGVCGLLACAKALSKGPLKPRRSVLFVAFDAEEHGLAGARFLLEHPVRPPGKLVAMVNLDMIGRGRFLDRAELTLPKRLAGIEMGPGVGLLGGETSPLLLSLARAACRSNELPSYTPQDFPLIRGVIESMSRNRDDSAVFRAHGVPAIFFSTSEHDDYHKPSDTRDKVSIEIVERVALITWRTLLAVDAIDDAEELRRKQ